MSMDACPCGSGKVLDQCCLRFISDEEYPETPEELMRSRYVAFALKKIPYLLSSWDPQTRNVANQKDIEAWANGATFTGLEIINTSMDKNKGMVEFKASYSMNGENHVHHEKAIFRKQAGIWYFKDGRGIEPQK